MGFGRRKSRPSRQVIYAKPSGLALTFGPAVHRIAPPTGPPPAVTDLAIIGLGSESAQLQWTDTGSTETAYEIERCTGAACTGFSAVATLGPQSGVIRWTDGSLQPTTTYRWRVRARAGTDASAYSAIVTGTTTQVPVQTSHPFLGVGAYGISLTQLRQAFTVDSQAATWASAVDGGLAGTLATAPTYRVVSLGASAGLLALADPAQVGLSGSAASYAASAKACVAEILTRLEAMDDTTNRNTAIGDWWSINSGTGPLWPMLGYVSDWLANIAPWSASEKERLVANAIRNWLLVKDYNRSDSTIHSGAYKDVSGGWMVGAAFEADPPVGNYIDGTAYATHLATMRSTWTQKLGFLIDTTEFTYGGSSGSVDGPNYTTAEQINAQFAYDIYAGSRGYKAVDKGFIRYWPDWCRAQFNPKGELLRHASTGPQQLANESEGNTMAWVAGRLEANGISSGWVRTYLADYGTISGINAYLADTASSTRKIDFWWFYRYLSGYTRVAAAPVSASEFQRMGQDHVLVHLGGYAANATSNSYIYIPAAEHYYGTGHNTPNLGAIQLWAHGGQLLTWKCNNKSAPLIQGSVGDSYNNVVAVVRPSLTYSLDVPGPLPGTLTVQDGRPPIQYDYNDVNVNATFCSTLKWSCGIGQIVRQAEASTYYYLRYNQSNKWVDSVSANTKASVDERDIIIRRGAQPYLVICDRIRTTAPGDYPVFRVNLPPTRPTGPTWATVVNEGQLGGGLDGGWWRAPGNTPVVGDNTLLGANARLVVTVVSPNVQYDLMGGDGWELRDFIGTNLLTPGTYFTETQRSYLGAWMLAATPTVITTDTAFVSVFQWGSTAMVTTPVTRAASTTMTGVAVADPAAPSVYLWSPTTANVGIGADVSVTGVAGSARVFVMNLVPNQSYSIGGVRATASSAGVWEAVVSGFPRTLTVGA